jgi:2-polyprenyl-3-methyl-5-hydroxy-6-metoxy-1,4-benzoquinol methylase
MLLSYGPTTFKKRVWDKEYSSQKWNFADNTVGDCVYAHLEKYIANGNILDIGCGSGNTATEMAPTYQSYIGVDISEEALSKAAKRSLETGRQDKNRFECGDFLTYVPQGRFDVILFRESMYHVPVSKVKATLDRYAEYLKEGGVFVVRLFAADRQTAQLKQRPMAMLGIMESEFDVLEKGAYDDKGRSTVIVFRPRNAGAQPRVDSAAGNRDRQPVA